MNQAENSCTNRTPHDLKQIGIITKYSLLDHIQSRRFLILLAIILAFGIILVIVSVVSALPILSVWGTSATAFTLLLGIAFGGDAISGEFSNKTGYFLLPNPIRRSSIYIGKWISTFIASSIIFGVFALVVLFTASIQSVIPYEFGLSMLFAWFYLAAVVGSVFFVSSLFKSSVYALLVCFLVLLMAFNIVVNVAGMIPLEPWFILTYGGGIIGDILTVPYPPHASVGNVGLSTLQVTTYHASVLEGLAIIGLYFAITTAAGLFLFNRRELN
jgi:ABC-2 type transport system permease protein